MWNLEKEVRHGNRVEKWLPGAGGLGQRVRGWEKWHQVFSYKVDED